MRYSSYPHTVTHTGQETKVRREGAQVDTDWDRPWGGQTTSLSVGLVPSHGVLPLMSKVGERGTLELNHISLFGLKFYN